MKSFAIQILGSFSVVLIVTCCSAFAGTTIIHGYVEAIENAGIYSKENEAGQRFTIRRTDTDGPAESYITFTEDDNRRKNHLIHLLELGFLSKSRAEIAVIDIDRNTIDSKYTVRKVPRVGGGIGVSSPKSLPDEKIQHVGIYDAK